MHRRKDWRCGLMLIIHRTARKRTVPTSWVLFWDRLRDFRPIVGLGMAMGTVPTYLTV